MSMYTGRRVFANGARQFLRELPSAIVVQYDGQPLGPEASQVLMNHSPDGFEWGYCGSGSAQLALALALHHFKEVKRMPVPLAESLALAFYQDLKERTTVIWDEDAWFLESRELEAILKLLWSEHPERLDEMAHYLDQRTVQYFQHWRGTQGRGT